MLKHTSTIVLLFAVTFLLGVGSGYFLRGLTTAPAPVAGESTETTRGVRGGGSGEGNGEGLRAGGANQEQQYRQFRARMISELSLTEEQIDPFFDIMMSNRRSMRTLREENRDQLRRDIRRQADEMHQEVRTVLTSEQFERWMEMSRQQSRNGNR